jgi:D-beta-D-heptose 7-phosphate kinase/D-beta-D-heptose 1-phosphate adenosyltransferase
MNNSKLTICNDLIPIINKFKNQKIAVIGDIILDKYIYGTVDRISPEAPVPIVKVTSEKYVPGGAANVGANISTLGGKVYLLGVTGNDEAGKILIEKAKSLNINTDSILIDKKKNTIKKTRVIGLNQQLLRIDFENTDYIESHFEDKFLDFLSSLKELAAIIISDYAKGTITQEMMNKLKILSKNKDIRLIIDPKPEHKSWYNNVSLITPNKKEAQEMYGTVIENIDDYFQSGKHLMEQFDSEIILTAGEKGMFVFEKNKEPVFIKTVAREVYDVSGAGDTVVASLCLALCSGAHLTDAAIIANHAAGIKVGKVGTAPVAYEELLQSFK